MAVHIEDLAIGDLARRTGVKVPTIRYYESIGLMPEPARSEGGQRRYGAGHLARLRFVRHARDLGFEIDAIRELLAMAADPQGGCGEAHAITRAHLAEVEDKIARLVALRDELRAMLACDNGRVADCRIIEVLADHEKCLHDSH
ncbi:MerR family transcriptional regulator [Salinarimonas ramus]|uniref:MerR family transcriptional regulator n=1 Tax=Salinarimonas ramus TaxID=690164 RepID=A0A917V586_9HYPH|nr:helix-turn-helix domain-containing protein [Salinarimonas ramus]GGK39288.1 MerR family transcriptional regulator [Salinarimonas ramus]